MKNIILVLSVLFLVACNQTNMNQQIIVEDEEIQLIEEPVEVEKPVTLKIDFKEVQCMALNLYHEARGEDFDSQLAAANVTINRMKSNIGNFRKYTTICETVYARVYNADGTLNYKACEFQWACDGISDKPKNMEVYNKLFNFSGQLLEGAYADNTDCALYYHVNDGNDRAWIKRIGAIETKSHGNHRFFKDKDGCV